MYLEIVSLCLVSYSGTGEKDDAPHRFPRRTGLEARERKRVRESIAHDFGGVGSAALVFSIPDLGELCIFPSCFFPGKIADYTIGSAVRCAAEESHPFPR